MPSSVSGVASVSPTRQTYTSGPLASSVARAVKANHAPSGENAADSPTRVMSLARAMVAATVGSGVSNGSGVWTGSGLSTGSLGSAVGVGLTDGVALSVGGAVGVSVGVATGLWPGSGVGRGWPPSRTSGRDTTTSSWPPRPSSLTMTAWRSMGELMTYFGVALRSRRSSSSSSSAAQPDRPSTGQT